MTGLLLKKVNGSFESFNSLYIINSNLVEQKFTGKQSDYTVFGHLPGQLNKLYSLWKKILKKQLTRYPNLYKSMLVENGDFLYIRNYEWSSQIWRKNFNPPEDDMETILNREYV